LNFNFNLCWKWTKNQNFFHCFYLFNLGLCITLRY
jgi:hypothetical protein